MKLLRKPFLSITVLIALGLAVHSCQEATVKNEYPYQIAVQEGFVLDSIYDVGQSGHGSWVALAEGPDGMFFAGDQFGGLYQFKMPAIGETLDSLQVDSIPLDLGHANGLIWAFNSLYVAVNRRWNEEEDTYGGGIYRLTDTNSDGVLDKQEMFLRLDGGGEHGPHSFLVSPDGTQLYFIAGNHVEIPDALAKRSRLPNKWAEDNLLTPYLDARGHATEIKAPGGWIARFDPDGSNFELIAAGFRNAFDFGFNAEGELFAFDADMEWDIGMPWYRPIRICHVTSGAEFGWRTGTGKWPAHYPDNLPAVINLGQGSPTGVVMGKDLAFPSRFRRGMLALDWSFGTMYFVDLQEGGSTYTASSEEFLSGVPLPLTDAIAGSDGHLYFATGGRRLGSNLYRVRYEGGQSTEPIATMSKEAADLRALRQSLESYHLKESPKAVDAAWNHLDHRDRFVRYAARIALEHQPLNQWLERLFAEDDAAKTIQAGLAAARMGRRGLTDRLLNKLLDINSDKINEDELTDLLRAQSLVLMRMGAPGSAVSTRLSQQLLQMFPSTNNDVNRLIAEILIHQQVPEATSLCVDLLEEHMAKGTNALPALLSSEVTARSEQYGPAIDSAMKFTPPSEAIFYALALSHARTGWTEGLHQRYFTWYRDIMSSKGGLSFKATMENARQQALTQVPEGQRQFMEELSGVYSPTPDLATLPQPAGPGDVYNVYDLNRIARNVVRGGYEGKFDDGKRMYMAALCQSCHRMNGEGGITGPDLSQLYTRFEAHEVMGAVFAPHDEISDQYAFTLFEMEDGSTRAGRIASESEEMVTILPSPYTTTLKVEIPTSEISRRRPSPVSPMPPGLMNRLNKDEIADLVAYIMSGANENHVIYGGSEGQLDD